MKDYETKSGKLIRWVYMLSQEMIKGIFFIILVLASCSQNVKESHAQKENIQKELNDPSLSEEDSTQIALKSENAAQAKVWLEHAILEYFNQELNDWSFMTTAEYNEFKIDMINSIYWHGIELDSLKKKWSNKYEVTADKTGVGFLIGAQDYKSIVIKTCKTIPSKVEGEYLFKLVLCDTGYDQCYESDVTVIEHNGSYAINDVREYYR